MRNSLLKICFLVFFMLVCKTNAQMFCDSAEAYIGKTPLISKIGISKSIVSSADTNIITFDILLSNPTVLYPDSIIFDYNNLTYIESVLERQNDSVYTAYLKFLVKKDNDTNVFVNLYSTALAGNDSLATLSFINVKHNNKVLPDFRGHVKVISIGTPLPYIRFAFLDQNYPNPVRAGESTTWKYYLDRESGVTMTMYNILGQATSIYESEKETKGNHYFIQHFDSFFAAGLYYMKLKTDIGTSTVPFFVFK